MSEASDRTHYETLSAPQLRGLEMDGTLPQDQWQAVMEELRRRERGADSGGSGSASSAETTVPGGSRLTEALQQLRALLVPGETLEAYAIQRRIFALTHRRRLVAATSGRLIFITRDVIRGYQPIDVRWQDIEDARLQVGVFGASLRIKSLNKEDLASSAMLGTGLSITGLLPEQAERVYRVCQAQSQAWREKRRIRDLDELRARAGGVQVGTIGGLPLGGASGTESNDPGARLKRAREMRDGGLITDVEYESIKA
ncbi:MAG: PH domain-containing protein, partial [Gemmatimonadaceae bacterium]